MCAFFLEVYSKIAYRLCFCGKMCVFSFTFIPACACLFLRLVSCICGQEIFKCICVYVSALRTFGVYVCVFCWQ